MSEQPAEHRYAGFWIRFLAFIIDSIVASIMLAIVAEVLVGGQQVDLTNLSAMLSRLSWETVITAILIIGCWMYFAATPGKMVFKAHVVDAKTYHRASTLQLFVRYLGYFVSLFCLGLGFIWIGIDRRKQGWHDKLAGTVVIIGPPDEDKAEAEPE
ncbi:MAG TPA: RDD family protein [Pseudomonadales bacterium]|nr:RDD family protein [Pseudomonadales bacterium]